MDRPGIRAQHPGAAAVPEGAPHRLHLLGDVERIRAGRRYRRSSRPAGLRGLPLPAGGALCARHLRRADRIRRGDADLLPGGVQHRDEPQPAARGRAAAAVHQFGRQLAVVGPARNRPGGKHRFSTGRTSNSDAHAAHRPLRPLAHRPACTSAAPAPRCTTTCWRARSAGGSSCGSRTPTKNGSIPGAEEEIIEGLRWLGLDWDEGPGHRRTARALPADARPGRCTSSTPGN